MNQNRVKLNQHIEKSSYSSGFTLIELLVVIAILGILASVVLIAINPAMRISEARDAQMKNDLGQLQTALEAYATAHNGLYPSTGSQYWCENCTYTGYHAKGKSLWIPNLVSEGFVKNLPTSPLNGILGMCSGSASGNHATYMYRSNGIDYKLWAHCMPKTGLNVGSANKGSAYCTPRPPYDSSSFVDSTNPLTKLKPMVDPARPTYAYAVYSAGYMCL